MTDTRTIAAGIDVGTECVKALVLADDGAILGRAVIPSRGSFGDRAHECLTTALDEAHVAISALAAVHATGFGASCAHAATGYSTEAACHARGAFHHMRRAMTVIDIGGREPTVIEVDAGGLATGSRSARRCAHGIGTFLMFAARHLDVHPTRLEELAASAEAPARISSYCSIFAGTEILERLREGASPEEVAKGCIRSIAERIHEIGNFVAPIAVTGGVPEYFPGVLSLLQEMTGIAVQAVPEPITAGSLGAALRALEVCHVAR